MKINTVAYYKISYGIHGATGVAAPSIPCRSRRLMPALTPNLISNPTCIIHLIIQ